MHYPDYMEIFDDIEEDVKDVRDRMIQLVPYQLLNRFLAMDFDKMPAMHCTFAQLGPLIQKLTLKDNGPTMHKFNSRVGKVAGRLLIEYCKNGTIRDKDLTMEFNRYGDNGSREKVVELAKFLKNLKTLDCYKVGEKWDNFSVRQITQYCPKLERLIVVVDYIGSEDFNINRVIPQHASLKRIKVHLQLYNHSGVRSIMSKLGKAMKEKTPNLASIEMEIKIDAYSEGWDLLQEDEFLSRFNENSDVYRHFREMDKLKRCIFSYSYLYEGVGTLEVKLK